MYTGCQVYYVKTNDAKKGAKILCFLCQGANNVYSSKKWYKRPCYLKPLEFQPNSSIGQIIATFGSKNLLRGFFKVQEIVHSYLLLI